MLLHCPTYSYFYPLFLFTDVDGMDDWLLRLDMTSKNCSHSILPQQILKIEYNKYEFIEIHCQIVLRDISRCFCNIVHEPIFFTSLNEGRDD